MFSYPPKAIAKAVASSNVAIAAFWSKRVPDTWTSPCTIQLPKVVRLPVAASIDNPPTVSPL